MGLMYLYASKPRWRASCALRYAVTEKRRERVVVSSITPFDADSEAVERKGLFVSAPHLNCGMALPTVGRRRQSEVDLLTLYSLLAESSVV